MLKIRTEQHHPALLGKLPHQRYPGGLAAGVNFELDGLRITLSPIFQDDGERHLRDRRRLVPLSVVAAPVTDGRASAAFGYCSIQKRDSCDYSRAVKTGKGHLDKVSEQHIQTALPVIPVRAV